MLTTYSAGLLLPALGDGKMDLSGPDVDT